MSDRVADILSRLGKTVESPRQEFADDLLATLLAELQGSPAKGHTDLPKRRRLGRLIGVAAAVLPFILAMVLLIRSFNQAGPTAAPSPDVVDPRNAAVTRVFQVGTAPAGVVAADGAVWVGHYHGDEVWRIDPVTGRRIATIHAGTAPIALAAGFGAVWSADSQDGSISRIDPATDGVTSIHVGGAPRFIAVGDGAVWAAGLSDQVLLRIDPTTNAVTRFDIGVTAGGIAVGPGAVWVTDPVGNRLLRFDPATGRRAGETHVGDHPTGVAVSVGAVWVADAHSNDLARVDARALRVTGRVPVGAFPLAVATDGRTAWVVSADGSLFAVSLAKPRVVRTTALGTGVQWIGVGPRVVWVVAYQQQRPGVLYGMTSRTG
jgi:streptogramin lyase